MSVDMMRLEDAAESLRREFEVYRERGTAGDITHRGREKNRGRSSAAIREEWVERIREKIDRLKFCMEMTHDREVDGGGGPYGQKYISDD